MAKVGKDKADGLRSATVAVYSLKGGVGKTSFSVNLAWLAACRSRRRTLLWDLDPQAASTWLLSDGPTGPAQEAQAIFSREIDARDMCRPSRIEGIDLIGADTSLRGLDHLLLDIGKKKRLAKLLESLSGMYDRIILDCPPGLTATAEQVLQAADLVVVPVIPSPLSQRALAEVSQYLLQKSGRHPPILPAFSMVDRRRALHRAAMEGEPGWPVVPMASLVEQMGLRRAPLGAFAPKSPALASYAALWTEIERRLSA